MLSRSSLSVSRPLRLVHRRLRIDTARWKSSNVSKSSVSSVAGSFQLSDYGDLAKAKLSALVVTTTAAGFVAGGGGPLTVAMSCMTGTALCSSSAAAWNQILERDRDALMKRTQQRPLIKQNGGMTVLQAQGAATLWGVSGVGLLGLGTDPVTAALGLSNIVLYAGVYTYMKPRSIYNTWVGAVVGAIPPVMGWTAAGGSILDVEAMLLAMTLYGWQMPHFLALAYMHRKDYSRGGFKMLPVVESPTNRESPNVILRYAVGLSAIPILATALDVTSSMFAVEGLVVNGYAIHVARQFQLDPTNAKARKIFLTSLWYLPCVLMLFLLHSKHWDEDKDSQKFSSWLTEAMHQLKEQGRQVCIHEKAVAKVADGANACPIVVGERKGHQVVDAAQTTATTVIRRATETSSTVVSES